VVCFAGFRLDPRSGELWENGRRQTLGEQPLAVLLALLEHPGQLVTREELRQRLWPGDTFVDFEHGVNAAVKRLREAVHDSADSPRIIDTLPRRGYRLIASVETSPGAARRTRLQASKYVRPVVIASVFLALCVAVGWKAWQHLRPVTRNGGGASVRRVTFAPGLQTHPTWSPDGRHLAYASDQGGNFEIWVQPVSGSDPVQITRSAAQDTEPDWSPVEDKVVFRRSGPDGGVFVAPAFGGPEQRLTSFGARPRWSPDGSRVLFLSTDEYGNGVLPRLFVVPAKGGAAAQEILRPLLDTFDELPAIVWHPDGRRVSLLGVPRGGIAAQLFTIDPAGGPLQQWRIRDARGLPSSVDIMAAEWAPSGKGLFILTSEIRQLQPSRNIWGVTVDPDERKGLTATCLTSGEGVYADYAVARDGKHLAFVSMNESVRLWSFPLDSSGRPDEARREPLTPPGARAPDLARDGRSLLYVLPASRGDGTELWLKDLNTNTVRSVGPPQPAHWAAPHWSPDARMVAYWSVTTTAPEAKDAEQGLAVWHVDTGTHQFLMTPRRETIGLRGHRLALPTDWSPDGQWVLASSDLITPRFSIGLWGLANAPRAEAAVSTLAADPAYNLWQGRFSPDGRWIAFVAQKFAEPGASVIAVMPRAGANASRWLVLTDPHTIADKPRWSPDGRIIYYLRADRGFYNVWAQPFDSTSGTVAGAPYQITHFENPEFRLWQDRGRFELCVSPSRLILPISETAGSVWITHDVRW
jgi:Tol biopolymer transport system component/DNA-binding winged helix-turn-helix (wHTH) protein